jgi:hypothetical protein
VLSTYSQPLGAVTILNAVVLDGEDNETALSQNVSAPQRFECLDLQVENRSSHKKLSRSHQLWTGAPCSHQRTWVNEDGGEAPSKLCLFPCAKQTLGWPILRALCEGWDKQDVRGRASGAEQRYPTLRKQREGWATREFSESNAGKGKCYLPMPAFAAVLESIHGNDGLT